MSANQAAAFIKRLNDIDRSKRRTEVFRDFCEMAHLALAKTTALPGRADAIEAEYMACVGRYRDPDDVRKMPELLAMTVEAVRGGGRDFLGEVAGEIGALDARLGQFFTPYDLSRFTAKLNLQGAAEIIEERGFVTLCDPAAGAGCMLLAAADELEAMGFDPATSLWFEAVEINRATFHMLHIQTAYRGMAGKNIHGNSLSLEVFDVAATPAAGFFVAKHGDPHARADSDANANHATRERQKGGTAVQLSLFE